MINNNDKKLNEGGLLDDAPTLKDDKPSSKWPWVLGAILIILSLFLLQWGMSKINSALNKKTTHVEEVKQHTIPSLPLPLEKKQDAPKEIYSHDDNAPELEAPNNVDKTNQDQILEARIHMLAKMQQEKENAKINEAMRDSSVLINIGVHETHSEETNQNAQAPHVGNPNSRYLQEVSRAKAFEVNATVMEDLSVRLLKGTVIQGVTESAIDSDLPNMIRAHVTEDIYGEQGDVPLIRNGDKLIGQYRSGDIRNGQVRLYVVWTRLIGQNNISINLNSEGSDPLGRAGMGGAVDHHYLERFGSAILMSTISASVATLGVSDEAGFNSEMAYRSAISGSFSKTANQELQNNMQIQNTIRPPQGSPISILVNQDISFEEAERQGVMP